MGLASLLRVEPQPIDRLICAWAGCDDPAFLCLSLWGQSENSEGTFFLLAVASTNIHPPLFACLAVSGRHLVVDGRNTSRAQGVDVTQRALVMARSFGDLLLSQGRN